MARVKQNSWLFFPLGLHHNLSREWQAASGPCQLAFCCSLGFGEQEHRYFLILQANSSTIYNEEENLWQWLHMKRSYIFTIKKHRSIHPFKMETGKLPAKTMSVCLFLLQSMFLRSWFQSSEGINDITFISK
jgi:hypothetical protein